MCYIWSKTVHSMLRTFWYPSTVICFVQGTVHSNNISVRRQFICPLMNKETHCILYHSLVGKCIEDGCRIGQVNFCLSARPLKDVKGKSRVWARMAGCGPSTRTSGMQAAQRGRPNSSQPATTASGLWSSPKRECSVAASYLCWSRSSFEWPWACTEWHKGELSGLPLHARPERSNLGCSRSALVWSRP